MAKAKRKAGGARPRVPVFVYFVAFKTLASKVVHMSGAAGVKENSMILRTPAPIRSSDQLRDIELKLSAAAPGNPEIILTNCSFLEGFMKELSIEEETKLRAQVEQQRKAEKAMDSIREGVEEAVATATGPRDAD